MIEAMREKFKKVQQNLELMKAGNLSIFQEVYMNQYLNSEGKENVEESPSIIPGVISSESSLSKLDENKQ